MPTYDSIPDADVDAESPITESLMFRLRDNPDAVARGDVSVPDAKKILIPEAPYTSETDTSKRLAPDGSNGVKWSAGTDQFLSNAGSTTGDSLTVNLTVGASGRWAVSYHANAVYEGPSSAGYSCHFAGALVFDTDTISGQSQYTINDTGGGHTISASLTRVSSGVLRLSVSFDSNPSGTQQIGGLITAQQVG